jgi:hypothetical protein
MHLIRTGKLQQKEKRARVLQRNVEVVAVAAKRQVAKGTKTVAASQVDLGPNGKRMEEISAKESVLERTAVENGVKENRMMNVDRKSSCYGQRIGLLVVEVVMFSVTLTSARHQWTRTWCRINRYFTVNLRFQWIVHETVGLILVVDALSHPK